MDICSSGSLYRPQLLERYLEGGWWNNNDTHIYIHFTEHLDINQESIYGNSTDLDINKQGFYFMCCKLQLSIITCLNAPFSTVLPTIY